MADRRDTAAAAAARWALLGGFGFGAYEAHKQEESQEESKAKTEKTLYTTVHVRNVLGHDMECLCGFINAQLETVHLAKGYLPLKEDDVFDKLQDGVLLCAMANALTPGTVDEKVVHHDKALTGPDREKHSVENLNLALTSLATVGIVTSVYEAESLPGSPPSLFAGLLVHIVRAATLNRMSLAHNVNLIYLMDDWQSPEAVENLKCKSQEDVLKLWVNYQLRNAGTDLVMENFGSSLADSAIYANLLQAVAPASKKSALTSIDKILTVKDNVLRATFVVKNAEILGIANIITPEHIASAAEGERRAGNARNVRNLTINTAFIYEIYSHHPNIQVPTDQGAKVLKESKAHMPGVSNVQKNATNCGTAGEDTLRMWINSFGVDPIVNFLDTDLRNGLVLLQVWEAMIPGSVNVKKLHKEDPKDLNKRKFQWLANCTEVMECAKQHGITVNCSASDIATGDMKNTLALVFLMMRLHSQIQRRRVCGSKAGDLDDKRLVEWFNKQMEESESSFRLKDINDPGLKRTTALGYLSERVLAEKCQLHQCPAPKEEGGQEGCGQICKAQEAKNCGRYERNKLAAASKWALASKSSKKAIGSKQCGTTTTCTVSVTSISVTETVTTTREVTMETRMLTDKQQSGERKAINKNATEDSCTPMKWLFDSVKNLPTSEAELDKYSASVITMLRRNGVLIFSSKLSPSTDTAVFRDVLLQLNAIDLKYGKCAA